jgi:hypothetical protein
MKKAVLSLFFVLAIISTYSQQDSASLKTTDSPVTTLTTDSSYYKVDYTRDQEQMNRNMISFMSDLEERKQKQKRAAMIRIGIGIAFLIVLIIGWRRRTLKK